MDGLGGGFNGLVLVVPGAAFKVVAAPGVNHWKVVDGALVVVIVWEGKFKNALEGAVAAVVDVVAVLVEEYYQDCDGL